MCRVDYADADTTVLASGTRKARKEHRCDECGRTIARGEKYDFSDYVVERSHGSHKICDRCQVPAAWLIKNCSGYMMTEVCEDICEHVREYPDLAAPLTALADGMKRQWRAEDGSLLPIPTQAPDITITGAAP